MDIESREKEATPAPQQRRRWPFGPVRTALIATVVVSIPFLLFPGIDLWFSRQFYNPEIGFPAAEVPAFQWLRWLSAAIVWTTVAAALVAVGVKLALPERRSLIPPAASLLLTSTLVVAPGLLVNGFLKTFSGRPRPGMTADFGGDLPFVSVWRFTDHCERNCSFVSGEASTAIWLLTFALVVPIVWRNRVAIIAFVLAVIFSLNRVAFGSHFLSDVLLSWTLTLAVIATVHHFVYVKPLPWLANETLEAGLTRTGRTIRGWFGRSPPSPPPAGSTAEQPPQTG